MPTQLKTFDPEKLIVSFIGTPIDGWADDAMVKLTRSERSWKKKVGSTGEFLRVRQRNKSGELELTLMQGSASNDYLSSVLAQDEALGTGFGPLLVKDVLGFTIAGGEGCYIEGMPDVAFQGDVETRVWKIIIPDLDAFIGGNFAQS